MKHFSAPAEIDIKGATDEQLLAWYNAHSGSKKAKTTLGTRAEAEAKCAELKQACLDLACGSSKKPAKGKAPAPAAKGKGASKSPAKGKSSKTETSGEEAGARGRVSSHSGKKIFIKTEKNANPRREGTHGHRSFEIIRTAGSGKLTYEQYIEKGGRSNDLAWDIDKGYLEVK